MKLPEKARHLRVIIAEMNRIASHLVGMGAYGLDLGTFSPFLYAFREREKILDLFEEACGARLTYSYLTVGGATARSAAGLAEEVREVPRAAAAGHRRIPHAADDQRDFRPAARPGIGIMSPEMAIDYGMHGPGAAWQRRRPRPAPRRRRALHRNVRRLRLRGDRRARRALPAAITSIRPCRARPCWGIVGTGSMCGCWK